MFWHVGPPKTGTTYLQDVLWSNRDTLDAAGHHVPGRVRREHLWAALEVGGADLSTRDPRARGAWPRLVAAARDALDDGRDVVLSHEFFAAASAEAAEAALRDLGDAEVHLVLTARPVGALVAAGWQERVKNGAGLTLRQVLDESPGRHAQGWRTWDLHGVLERWAPLVAPERVHVVTVAPAPAPASTLWHRWRELTGLPDDWEVPDERANASLGVVETELLRRLAPHLGAFARPVDRGEWIRGVLAEQHLRPGRGARTRLPDDVRTRCREATARAVALIRERGLHVVGDLADLDEPPVEPSARDVADVGDAELLDAAGPLVARLLASLREAREGGGPGAG